MSSRRTLWTVSLAAGLALACGGGRSDAQSDAGALIDEEVAAAKADAEDVAGPSVAGAPQVGESYQRSIDRAWQKAVGGENPAYACAGLKGRLVGNDTAATDGGRTALFACNVLVPVRYFQTLLDRVDEGAMTCQQVMTSFLTQLPAMTLSVEGIEGLMEAVEADPEGGFARGLGAAVDSATVARGLEDPKSEVGARLAERMTETCPDLAPLMIR